MADPAKKKMAGSRGVTRPMKMHGEPGSEQRERMMRMHHQKTLWVYWTLVLLGFWMMIAPLTFGYDVGVVQPSGGRSVWLSLDARIAAMKWSDIISGAALVFFGWRSLKPGRLVSGWVVCFIGIWLSMAPLVFWAPTAVAYANGTFVGAWVIALSILIPGMPGMMMFMEPGAEVPPGWSYNPSSWPQRSIMIAAGFAGWLVSRYLAAYQLGYIDSVWDPFFGTGSRQVLDSEMSHSLPISDAGLGSLAYTFEFLMGFMGSPKRWRTMPWMVTVFGILVIPLGLVHIFLVISQPVVVGSWCTFCLLAAAIMLAMIPLEADEVVAMGQFIRRAGKRGEPLWKTFWKGGSDPEGERGGQDERSPAMMSLPDRPRDVLKASVWGLSVPWNLVGTSVLGLWMVFTPGIFGFEKPVSDLSHLGGLLTITFSVLAFGEVIRSFRWVNVLLGLGLAAVPLFFPSSGALWANHLVTGLAIAALSLPKGRIKERYGSWQRLIR